MTFADLRAGGRALAELLAARPASRDALVLGIVRGGVYPAQDVARALDLPLDLIVKRALIQDGSGGLGCAVRVAGTLVLDEWCTALPADSPQRTFVDEALLALAAREVVCRGPRAPARVAERTVFLVDNGMRTGRTMALAIRAVRSMNAGRIIAAAPVGSETAIAHVAQVADEVHCVATPAVLGNVAMAYARFDVPHDDRIHSLLEQQ